MYPQRIARQALGPALLVTLVVLAVCACGGGGGGGEQGTAESKQPGKAVETLGNKHIESVDAEHKPYNTDPPTSGPHLPYSASWGVHREPIPDELQVHNLEDGGVVMQYGEGVSSEEVKELARITGDYERVVLAPRPSLPEEQIVLTAWGRILRLSSVDEVKIRSFIEAYEGIDHHTAGA